ncbi:lipoyl synthase [Candidatus Woesearchaeota archaeon]|nr:lipoyl synthase [Candidatus Woesearchaeota archaeon]HIH38039.1 lipoyl synthase [Candidatus Woesearchaeota archaeon]HIH48558.1 lipoyl synthase [Candidatus Woesearchaeota archaeon]HIJ04261.1 lipoyl synthase [Candidatus Woesearchaeota archaeon]
MTISEGKPEWLKIRLETGGSYSAIQSLVKNKKLATVCQEAKCPNIYECWSGGTATFMVLGDTCTRGCRFCHVKTKFPAKALDPEEPLKLAQSVAEMNLSYVVITSVDRDDLPDQGAGHFSLCIKAVKEKNPGILVEVLTPDFRGDMALVDTIIAACPDVFAHNVEVVARLQKTLRDPRASYEQSLAVLSHVKKKWGLLTKSSLMVGVGETQEEMNEAMDDLRAVGVDMLTIGQYLQPTTNHYPVKEYVTPEVFKKYELAGREKGFASVASGPFVRSSYRAGEFFAEHLLKSCK